MCKQNKRKVHIIQIARPTCAGSPLTSRVGVVDMRMRLHQMRMYFTQGLEFQIMYQPAHAAHQQHIQPKNAKQQRHNAHFEVGDFQQNNEWQYDEPFAALAVMA